MSCLEISTLGKGCILACKYCYQENLAKAYKGEKYMSLDTFTTCISKVPKHVEITFSGYAECFLNPLATDMILWAFYNGYKINLYSTLTGLNIHQLSRLEKVKFNHISIHLPDKDGIMQDYVDDNYLEVAKKFNNIFPNNHAHVYGKKHPKLEFFNIREMEVKIGDLHTRANNIDKKLDQLRSHDYVSGKIRCGVVHRVGRELIDINVLLPDGRVSLCCMTVMMEHIIGNLLTMSYEELFQSEEYKRIIRGLDDENEEITCRWCKEAIPIK